MCFSESPNFKDERSYHICFLNMLSKSWFTVHLSTWYSSHLVLNCHVFTERCSDLTSKGERSNHIWYLTAAKSATKSGKLFCGKMIHTPTPSKLDRGAELCSAAIKNFVTMLIWIVENLLNYRKVASTNISHFVTYVGKWFTLPRRLNLTEELKSRALLGSY